MSATLIERECAAYLRDAIDINEFERRVGGILEGTWPPPPEPCRCVEPDLCEVTSFGDVQRHYLCVVCGRYATEQ